MLQLLRHKATTAKTMMLYEWYRTCNRSEFTWRYVANLRPSLKYQRARRPLSPVHEGLVRTLNSDGIVITSVRQLFGDTRLFEELERAVQSRELSTSDAIKEARARIDTPDRVKSYLVPLLGPRPTLRDDIFFRFALHPAVLSVANGYFGMLTRLRHYNVWHNFATRMEARESQLWHRDPEDRYVLKMFVYLTDVDEGAGALTYAPGTHARGAVKATPESSWMSEGRTQVHRSNDAQLESVVPRQKWITARGSKGTIVFADTRGFHKGGLARERDRVLYMCMFTSQASTLLDDLFDGKTPLADCPDGAMAFAIGA